MISLGTAEGRRRGGGGGDLLLLGPGVSLSLLFFVGDSMRVTRHGIYHLLKNIKKCLVSQYIVTQGKAERAFFYKMCLIGRENIFLEEGCWGQTKPSDSSRSLVCGVVGVLPLGGEIPLWF